MALKKKPQWGKEVMKALIDRDMTLPDLADEMNMSRQHIGNVINGTFNYPDVKRRICEHLGITIDEND